VLIAENDAFGRSPHKDYRLLGSGTAPYRAPHLPIGTIPCTIQSLGELEPSSGMAAILNGSQTCSGSVRAGSET